MIFISHQYTFMDLLKDYSYVPKSKKNAEGYIKEILVLLFKEVKIEFNDLKEFLFYVLSLKLSENHFMALLKDHNLVSLNETILLSHSNDNWPLKNDGVYKAS